MCSRRARTGRLHNDERGVALVMALVVALILALLVAGITQQVIAELQIGQLTRQDAIALYLAQAGVEHQIYLLKNNKDAGPIAYTNYPVTVDQTRWFATSLTCLLNCAGTPSARRWRIRSTGELRRYNPDSTYTVMQNRAVLAEVDIVYDGVAPNLYRYPLRVTMYRWEEEVP